MVKVHFEREIEDCFYCPFCRNDNEYNGWTCQEIKIPYYWIEIGQIDKKCPFRNGEEN